ncbi:MAG: DUF5009 domain-containing protein [Acidobacteria bacterium]|nr:DUF5009 domain-containing protein [Acidobacteriota bacterium]
MAARSEEGKQRLTSLDAFRGATMALMVLVNDPGNGEYVYAPLEHAAWHGWTPTDVVFPSFVWIVGVAITLALGRKLAAHEDKGAILRQAFRRAAILFLLGLLVYAVPKFDLSTQRILGVLQRIAICYAVTVPIYLSTRLRGQVVWIVGLLSVYWVLMAFVPVPGYGAGRLDVEGNFAHYIDRIVLGAHNYEQTKTWDPEGIVSTLPAIATMLLGVVAGHIVAWQRSLSERIRVLLVVGILLIAAGLLCDQWLPINKKLWTSSFTLFMAGLDFAIFGLFLWIADGLGYKRVFQPFVILGMNAIAIYMVSEAGEILLSAFGWKTWIYQNVFLPLASPVNASLLYALAYTFANFLVAWALWRKRLFFRV